MTSDRSVGGVVEGAVPEYIPPHLQNQVFDFRNEDDGSVSFAHPEATLGLSPMDSRVKLTREQYNQTFNNNHRRGNFLESMNNQYAPLQRRPKNTSQRLNEGIAGALRKAFNWGTSDQGKAVGTAGLLSALVGGVGGYMWGDRAGEGKISKALLMALLAGTAGAGATAWGQNKHNRREAFLSKTASSSNLTNDLIRLIEDDPSLGSWERAQILRALTQVSDRDGEKLYRLARTSAGAGVGILIMHFLKAKGLLPMLAGGILGGMVGSMRGPGLDYNAQGQLSMTNYL